MFNEKVYSLCKKIPFGMVSSYGNIASALGCKAYRAVGNALNNNPYKDVPCFKVVKSDGSLGGFALGSKEKIRRLSKEGILVKNGKIVDFEKKLYRFKQTT